MCGEVELPAEHREQSGVRSYSGTGSDAPPDLIRPGSAGACAVKLREHGTVSSLKRISAVIRHNAAGGAIRKIFRRILQSGIWDL